MSSSCLERRTTLVVLAALATSRGVVLGLSASTIARDASSARNNLMRILEAEVKGSGTLATVDGARRIERCIEAVERSASDDTRPMFPRDLATIDGVWRLRYTNNAPRLFAGEPFPIDALGGLMPSSPSLTGSSSGSLWGAEQEVYQTIDIARRRVVNTICLGPWRSESRRLLELLPFLGTSLASSRIRLDLDHAFVIDGEDRERLLAGTNRLVITLEEIRREVEGFEPPTDLLPEPLRRLAAFDDRDVTAVPEVVRAANRLVPTSVNAGAFDTTYCDSTLRISRGVVGREVRVFERAFDGALFADRRAEAEAAAARAASSSSRAVREKRFARGVEDRFIARDDADGDDPDDLVPSD